jgi:hypothetical protein
MRISFPLRTCNGWFPSTDKSAIIRLPLDASVERARATRCTPADFRNDLAEARIVHEPV